LGAHDNEQVIEAATLILRHEDVLPGTRQLAERLSGKGSAPEPPRPRAYVDLAQRKRLIRLNPRDSLLLTETALIYTGIGELEAAARLIRTATALSPSNRYVLRSAARFWMHARDPGQALHLLNRTPALRYDPWLLSAKVAIESAAKRPATAW